MTYRSPGVYSEEIARLPPTVTAVETAIAAFIGFTAIARDEQGASLTNIPTRITSLQEYEHYFGRAPSQAFSVNVTQRQQTSTGTIVATSIAFNGTPVRIPPYMLYYSLQLFFANGGGPCYIVSIGNTAATAYSVELFTAAIAILEQYDEPTLYVFPDACSHREGNLATDGDVADILDAALQSCARLQDRFTIADVRDATLTGTHTHAEVGRAFRDHVGSGKDIVKYGAAYFPYLETNLNFLTCDEDVSIATHTLIAVDDDGVETPGAGSIAANTAIAAVINEEPEVYHAVTAFIQSNTLVTLPPSGAIAGVYARVDASGGVWKSPANVGLAMVNRPAVPVSNEFNDQLNVDTISGKSVNTIRAFAGKGILVWGARTLAGNDSEWRYVAVRRFCIFVEESVKKATAPFVFEPNAANTWTRVRTMIENFLTLQWRAGALAGAKPEQAFYVRVGLNQTMTPADVANGCMIVEIGMAVLRPAEFIVLRFSHNMQKP